MPKIKSAKKALRQNISRNKKNSAKKVALKKAIKEFKKVVIAKEKEQSQIALQKVYKIADKISKSKLIKKNKANRIKSRASKYLAKKLSTK